MVGLLAIGGLVALPAATTSGASTSVTGYYGLTTSFINGSLETWGTTLYPNGSVSIPDADLYGHWTYNGAELIMIFRTSSECDGGDASDCPSVERERSCTIDFAGAGNPSSGFGGTVGEGSLGECDSPNGGSWTMSHEVLEKV
jgi:hypothetical protein